MIKKPLFSILYLEDSSQDAMIFVAMIRELLIQHNYELPTESEPHQFLAAVGIEWVQNSLEFINKLNQSADYQLFLLDMKIDGENGFQGWNIINHIREKRQNTTSSIWILSQYIVLQTEAAKIYSIAHFFCKDTNGLSRLKLHLTELFFPIPPTQTEEYIDLSSTEHIPVSEILLIKKDTRDTTLYQLRSNQYAPFSRTFKRQKIYDTVFDQIKKKNIQTLLPVSKTIIVNTSHIKRIRKEDSKNYYLTLTQYGDNNEIKVSYGYLKDLKDIFGNPLPHS